MIATDTDPNSGTAGAVSVPPLQAIVEALRDPARYPHPAESIDVIETHISIVVLAGAFAYKFKKPVALGFVDFSTLAARRHFCEEELRLNRRTARELYVGVVSVAGTAAAPVLDGDGPAIEYALKMRRFSQERLFDAMAWQRTLKPAHVDALAGVIAAFHSRIDRALPDARFGTPPEILARATENFAQTTLLAQNPRERDDLAALADWTRREFARRDASIGRRLRQGFVRECHGDLHLGNIALIDDAPVPFDCIEFNASFRWIDVMSEIAFLAMDLMAHGLHGQAWRCLDRYLQESGDYAGVELLRFYLVYRAMVRAKIGLIRDRQMAIGGGVGPAPVSAFRGYLDLARGLSHREQPAIILMHGLSGSGKTTVAQVLLESSGAIRMRSDVERKRSHGLVAGDRRGADDAAGLYAPAVSAATYRRLLILATGIVAAGWPVIIDAAFLRREDRDAFRELARRAAVPFVIVACEAGEATLRERVATRERAGADASDAGIDVLERQLATVEPPGADERGATVTAKTDAGPAGFADALAEVVRRVSRGGT